MTHELGPVTCDCRKALRWAAAGLIALQCAVPVVAHEQPALTLVLAGQSNMVGNGWTAELTASDAEWPRNVRYWSEGQEFNPLQRERFGPELGLALKLGPALGARPVYLVKHAVGTTSLLAWAPVWDATLAEKTGNANVGSLYARLLASVREAPLPDDSVIGAVLWMQGERDSRFPEVGGDYFQNLRELIAALRRDLDSPQLPFILGLVNPPPEQYLAREDVRAAQRRAAAEVPHVYLIETDDLTKHSDRLHYDTQGTLELGTRFAEVVLDLHRHTP